MDPDVLPEALKAIMTRHGWSQTELAAELGVSQSWVSQTSRGMKDSGIAKVQQLLGHVGWEVRITPKTEDDPVNRRDFVTAVGSIAFVPSPKVGPYQDPGYVRTLADRLARDRYEQGGIPVTSTALRHMKKVGFAISGNDRKLQSAASDLACETARIFYDSRRYDVAQRAGSFALNLARRSGDVSAQANACSALSRISIDRGKGDRGIVYARQGLSLPDLPPAQRAWLKLRLARSLALVAGRERAARDRLAELGDTEGMSAYERADMKGNVGVALAGMRAYPDAHAAISAAVKLSAQCSPLLLVAYQAWQVEAALTADEPLMAAEHMTALARIAPMVSSARVNSHITGILAMSARWAHVPEMRQAREHLLSVQPD
ncbi:MAG: helix-turn-helix domain-containing protein [Gemmatimonadales bacterium]